MQQKLNTLKDRFPEDHPIFKIHKYSESQNVVIRYLKFALSAFTVFIILIPFETVRIAWALILNVFTNHLENYFFYLKRSYSALLSEIGSFLCYFIFLLPYVIYRRLMRTPARVDILNTDKISSEYQS
jgi:hypothetical protein